MTRTSTPLLAVLFLACLLASFLTTQAWQARQTPPSEMSDATRALSGWLRLLPDQIKDVANVDPAFAEELPKLEAALEVERETLATLFENPDIDDDAITAQVERVIAAHDRVERRVARYLLAIRPHLTAEQREQLFDACADGIREAGGKRWRHGRGGGTGEDDLSDDRGRGRGRGGAGRGRRGTDSPNQRENGPASQPGPSSTGETP